MKVSTGKHNCVHKMTGRPELLWKKYFSDPSQWWDNRISKISSKSPDFRHKTTKESLWIDSRKNPCWVLEELNRRGLLMSITEAAHREYYVGTKENFYDSEILSFMASLKACIQKKDLYEGSRVHGDIRKRGLLRKSTHLGNMLVTMYAKCGALVEAHLVLDELPVRDVVSWSTLISGYAQKGQGEEAVNCFQQMQSEGLSPNAITYACFLKACGIIGAVEKGKQIHDEIVSQGLLEKDGVLGNALVGMYAKCGALSKAAQVLDELPTRDVVSWSALIAGYVKNGQGEEALICFQRMQSEGFFPDAITYTSLLQACGITGAVDRGKQIHDEIVRQGLLGKDVVLGNALVDMYAKCGALAQAQEALDNLSIRNIVSWSALITGYVEKGQGKEALNCFQRMKSEGLSPNAITYACALKACGIARAIETGREIHYEILNQGLLGTDVMLGTAVVNMYVKCGVLSKAQQVHDELPVRNVLSWNSLLAGYAQLGQCCEVLDCLQQMRREGLAPDAITYIYILKACGITGAVDVGKKIHDEIVNQDLLGKDVVLGTALVDMYAKCGVLTKAQRILDELPVRDVVSWSSLIAGYAQQGQGEQALNCFRRMQKEDIAPNNVSWNALIGAYAQQGHAEEALDCFQWMQREGISPDEITFVCVLNACSHSGLVDEGQTYFEIMSKKYGIKSNLEHHICMIDLFGRAGDFDKAMKVIKEMPSSDYWPVWSALLGACRKWGNVNLGRMAFEHAIQVDKREAAAYVCMANIYAAAGMHEDARKIEEMRVKNRAWKQPGRSLWIDDCSGDVHSFVAGDTKYAQRKEVEAKLQDIALKISQQGYFPTVLLVSQNISNDAKKDVLCRHSEKLAIACALINTTQGKDIRIVKNMRVCDDCHVVTSLISKLENRKITVKDANRLHVFEDGKCSCGDYW
ncbi:hypothetical protein GOP47_0019224 [Adiantum capillus-veneris]|uniref:DYW domain-containing protein n=1 Tax=Adiantum capillus-veneris TaxID=13818 RepID=A0A9D4UF04_ADICA|nr:hypothetical protein GOP47_0019224 [Adiantum capillus-veneris]